MRRRFDLTRGLQIGFLVLLALCAAQMVYWVLDEVNHTTRLHAEITHLLTEQTQAAKLLLDAGVPADRIADLFPGVIFSSGPERVTIDPRALETLRLDRFHRMRRIGWEGAFFLVVMVAAMAVLAQALHRDAQLRRRQQNFLAAVTHEFKSPLAALRLSAETLDLRDPPPDQRRKLVGRLLEDINRLDTMIGNLLDTARLEEGRVRMQPQVLHLPEAVDASLSELSTRAAASGVELRRDIAAVPPVQADPLAVRTVLRNLIDNAIKATAAAGGGTVTVSLAGEGRFVKLEVKDTGIGFAPPEARRLFDKFYRPGDELRRRSPGSGLGLYIVRRFVELEQGRVTAASEGPGKGAAFTVLWPAAERGAA